MRMTAMLQTDFIEVAVETERNAGWAFKGRKVKGVELIFSAVDRNYLRQNRWTFVVRVPDDITNNYVGVMPTAVPNRKVWAGLERRSLQFQYGSIGKHAMRLYAKLSIEDIRGEKNKHVLTEDDHPLPPWIDQFDPKPKRKVALTDGHDGGNLVSLVKPDDFAAMIRMFVALKAWVRDEKYNPKYNPQPAWDEETRRQRRLVTAKPLCDMRIAVTGHLVRGIRKTIYRWFLQLGAEPKDHVTSECDLLVVGVHYKDDDRKKIRDAAALKIPMLSESKFYQKYRL
jgi:hypothetical protein